MLLTRPQSVNLLNAIKEYEQNKWKVIGQKVGKPAKVGRLLPCDRVSPLHLLHAKGLHLERSQTIFPHNARTSWLGHITYVVEKRRCPTC